MKDLSDLSILVTCFNKELHIDAFVSNLIDILQWSPQIVIVDDHSTDFSLDILRSKLSDRSNVQIVGNESNLGSAASRNLALSLANREFVFFWDIDDEIDINILIQMVGEMRVSNAAINQGKFTTSELDSNKKASKYSNAKTVNISENQSLLLHEMGFWRFIYLRRFLLKYGMQFVPSFSELGGRYFILDDVFWMIWITSVDEPMVFSQSESPLYLYNITNHTSSSWRKFQRQAMLFPKASILFLNRISASPARIDLALNATFEKMLTHLRYLTISMWLKALPHALLFLFLAKKLDGKIVLGQYVAFLKTIRKAFGNTYYQLFQRSEA